MDSASKALTEKYIADLSLKQVDEKYNTGPKTPLETGVPTTTSWNIQRSKGNKRRKALDYLDVDSNSNSQKQGNLNSQPALSASFSPNVDNARSK